MVVGIGAIASAAMGCDISSGPGGGDDDGSGGYTAQEPYPGMPTTAASYGTGATAGTTMPTGGGIPQCYLDLGTDDCASCFESKCCGALQSCFDLTPDCGELAACLDACDPLDSTCTNGCRESYPDAVWGYDLLAGCAESQCGTCDPFDYAPEQS